MINIALDYLGKGLSVIPVKKDKSPLYHTSWKKFQSEKMSPDQAFQQFGEADAIAIIGGSVSGNLFMLDFDNHFNDIKQILHKFLMMLNDHDLQKVFPIVKTQNNGFHVYMRTPQPEPARHFAKKDKKAFIESKGEGGYVLAPPTSGYEMYQGSFEDIPRLSIEEFELVKEIAYSFNKEVDESQKFNHQVYRNTDPRGERPGDIYNSMADAQIDATQALIARGWKFKNDRYLTRPGKDRGVSATFGYVAPGILYVFSSNASPFESNKAYTPFQVIALLNHAGEFGDAVKWICEEYNIETQSNKFEKAYKTVRNNIRKGQYLTEEEIKDLANEIKAPFEEVKIEVEKANEKYKDEQGYDQMPPIEKAEIFLKKKYDFIIDVIERMPYYKIKGTKQWNEVNIDTLYREIQHEGIKFSIDNLKSLMRSDFVQLFNPFESYFKKMSEWDGQDHIGKLAGYLKTSDDVFFRSMLEKALVRNIKCALEPYYYNRMVLTLISEKQELGKSYFFQFLNPFGLKYYTDEPLKNNKDSRFALCENFIYNLEELDSLSKFDIGQLKATISTRGVKDRLPYASHKSNFPRVCSFYGSTNRSEFLVDDENTRWLCIEVNEINWAYSKEVDIRKVWAQAWHLYKMDDYNCELDKEEKALRNALNDNHKIVDFETGILKKYFEANSETFMTNGEIQNAIQEKLPNVRLNANAARLGRMLAIAGFKKAVKNNIRGWQIQMKGAPVEYLDEKDLTTPF